MIARFTISADIPYPERLDSTTDKQSRWAQSIADTRETVGISSVRLGLRVRPGTAQLNVGGVQCDQMSGRSVETLSG